MGCISSKQAVSATPAYDYTGVATNHGSGILVSSLQTPAGFGDLERGDEGSEERSRELAKLRKGSSNARSSLSLRLGNLNKYVEAEQVAAGWPAWLSAAAGEAIQGWVPLRADSFEKLEKIGQGTYSSVYRARDVETGRMVALKKVRFDNFQPESVRFMSREIKILRRLDHPNIMKLEGIITSRLSCSIYLVFDYMEHDLSGLLSCPDIKFSDAQVKCYMKQLLSGIEHCHSLGIMHRDIKVSNILVNNEGILKVADFGLANVFSSRHRQPLTSRVVTLWYRPPELILGATNYGTSVDLWSVGCVFAELLFGKPILKGRTEVEQLHKIFKLCGSPSEDYWRKSKLPHATMFKPQRPYESSLRERCKEFPTAAVNLIETFLSIEPYKRGTASSALQSEYFRTEPYACEPSSLPKYPPNKEIDTKSREEAQRKKTGFRKEPVALKKPRRGRKALQEPNTVSRLPTRKDLQANTKFARRNNGSNSHVPKGKEGAQFRDLMKSSFDTASEVSHLTNASQEDIVFSNPLQVPASSGFSWAPQKENAAFLRSYSRSGLRSQTPGALGPSGIPHAKYILDSGRQQGKHNLCGVRTNCKGHDSYEVAKDGMRKNRSRYDRPDSFDVSEEYHSQELSAALYQRNGMAALRNNLVDKENEDRVEFSGPMLSGSQRIDEFLQRHENHIRKAVRRTTQLQRD
ncbi:protein IMPAIRED IN BABA-INDUCED STERILITY 1-like isoform X2 [Malania oleifera]|nr:protein IMPAIRED IN BABA-INDUCED STERILITY 1-like isoform X2 [Malania oleifera]